jgi:hypothetical protein
VIDLRNVAGNVFGGDQMREWTVMEGARRFTFVNPLNGLYDRVAVVKALAGDMPVEGRILFTGGAKFPKGLPRWTSTLASLTPDFLIIDGTEAQDFHHADAGAVPKDASRDGSSAAPGVVPGDVPDPDFEQAWAYIKSTVQPSSLAYSR